MTGEEEVVEQIPLMNDSSHESPNNSNYNSTIELLIPNNNHQINEINWFDKFLNRLRLSNTDSKDILPVKQDQRTWTKSSFFYFWITDSFNINTIQLASTGLLNNQLSINEVILSILLGYSIVAIFIYFSLRIGCFNHISSPMIYKLSFGLNGSIWPILNRGIVGIIWYSVQCWIGGQCMQLLIKSIMVGWYLTDDQGNNHGNWSDHFYFELLGFGLFWFISLFIILIPPYKLQGFLKLKAKIVPVASIGLLSWVLMKSYNTNNNYTVKKFDTDYKNTRFWTFVMSTMNCIANFTSLMLNISDFSRFAKDPKSIEIVNFLSIPFCFTLTSIIGILISDASKKIYGVSYWSPLDILDRFLKDLIDNNDDYSMVNEILIRSGILIISITFIIAQIGTNIANSLSSATVLNSLLSDYINLKRGSLLCAIFALLIQPWRFFESSNKFTVYLSYYNVFLSGIIGIILTDYYIIRHGYINLLELYSHKNNNLYKYNQFELNWRAFLSYFLSILPNLPGFLRACEVITPKSNSFIYLVYEFNFFIGFATAMIFYLIFCLNWPIIGLKLQEFWKLSWFEEWKLVEDFENQLKFYNIEN